MADAIWNNNYLLSNLDSQKLYAQAPLTTGVSGTSAYIGIEPSARYNETVLWEGEVMVTTAQNALNLSESLNNFNSFKIYDKSIDRTNVGTRITEFASVSSEKYFGTEDAWVDSWQPTTEGCCYIGHNYYSANDNRDKIVTLRSFYKSLPTSAAEGTHDLGKVYKIIGINRKEV